MKKNLTTPELELLIRSIFPFLDGDKNLAIIVDVPDDSAGEHLRWTQRREIARDWQRKLTEAREKLKLNKVDLFYYPNTHNHNADLPFHGYSLPDGFDPCHVSFLSSHGSENDFEQTLSRYQFIMALTTFSATAPLVMWAKKYGFRAVTMPGFTENIIPALKLDFHVIEKRLNKIKVLLDKAVGLDILFACLPDTEHSMYFDLRTRESFVSAGRVNEQGKVANLPGGECYIVPYEGEKNFPSLTCGELPVQFDDDVVVYRVEKNRVQEIGTTGEKSEKEAVKLKAEPACGNIAEVGFGVLKDLGIKPTGDLLLDEKLGLHIAFGRSDHLGGSVGVQQFLKKENVTHEDHVYISEMQNKISLKEVALIYEDGSRKLLMRNNSYIKEDLA